MGRVKRNLVSFAARLWGSPLPPAHASRGPSDQVPTNTLVPKLPMATSGSNEGDLGQVGTEIADYTENRSETGTLRVGDSTAHAQVIDPEIVRIDLDPTVPESSEGVPPAVDATDLEREAKSREDRGKEVELGEKRIASEAGLIDEGTPKKTFPWTKDDPDRSDRFSFQFVWDKYLMQDQEAASHLWCNMNLPGV